MQDDWFLVGRQDPHPDKLENIRCPVVVPVLHQVTERVILPFFQDGMRAHAHAGKTKLHLERIPVPSGKPLPDLPPVLPPEAPVLRAFAHVWLYFAVLGLRVCRIKHPAVFQYGCKPYVIPSGVRSQKDTLGNPCFRFVIQPYRKRVGRDDACASQFQPPFYPAVAVAWHERRFVRCLHVCHVYLSFCHKAAPPSTWVSSCQFKNAGKAPHWRGAGFPLFWRRVYSVRGWENTPECTARGHPCVVCGCPFSRLSNDPPPLLRVLLPGASPI